MIVPFNKKISRAVRCSIYLPTTNNNITINITNIDITNIINIDITINITMA